MRELVSQKTLGCAGENAVQKQVVGADPRAGLQREGISRRAEQHGAALVLPSGERCSELPERERAKRFVAEDATDKGRRGPGLCTSDLHEVQPPRLSVSAAADRSGVFTTDGQHLKLPAERCRA